MIPPFFIVKRIFAASAAYQKGLVPLLIQASPHPPFIALCNRSGGLA